MSHPPVVPGGLFYFFDPYAGTMHFNRRCPQMDADKYREETLIQSGLNRRPAGAPVFRALSFLPVGSAGKVAQIWRRGGLPARTVGCMGMRCGWDGLAPGTEAPIGPSNRCNGFRLPADGGVKKSAQRKWRRGVGRVKMGGGRRWPNALPRE